MCGRAVGLALLKRLNALGQAKVVGPSVEAAPSYIMFSKQTIDAAVVARFDQAMLTMHRDGTFAKIERAYLAHSAPR